MDQPTDSTDTTDEGPRAFLGAASTGGPTVVIATIDGDDVKFMGCPGTSYGDWATGVMTKIADKTPPYDVMEPVGLFDHFTNGTFGPYGEVVPLDDKAKQQIDSTILGWHHDPPVETPEIDEPHDA